MRQALILSLIVVASTLAGQQRRVVMGPGPDLAKDWPQPDVSSGRTPEQITDAIAAYAQKLFQTDHFSGVVLVARDGQPMLQRAWGENLNLETRFNIGSINKAFTRRAIEQLAARGTLALDDRVRRHLPDYPSAVAERITIRQLLENRSGLGDVFGPKYLQAPPASLRELSDFLPLFADDSLQFEPGTAQRYSNAGYIVLGLIIERVSGMKYRHYVQKNIFDPAGMKNSGFWAADEEVPNRATGYTVRGPGGSLLAKRVPNTATLPGRPSSAGGAYATAGDLLRFFQWTGERGIGVAGGAPGLNALAEVDDGWTVIVLANYDPPAAEAMGRGAMAIIRGAAARAAGRADGRSVPLTPAGHLFTVEAEVNGRGPFHFAVDTGAGGKLRLSPDLARTLGLTHVGEVMSGDPSGRNASPRPVVRVDLIKIGGLRFESIDASVGSRIGDGVIGLSLFGTQTVTLDYPQQELRVTAEPLAAGEHVIPFTFDHEVPEIEIQAAGTVLQAHVDSGSPALLNVPPTAGVPLRGEPRVVGRGRTESNEFVIRAATLAGELRVAGWSLPDPTVDIVELFPMANLGSRFLRHYAVSFDMANRRMGLAAPARPVASGAGQQGGGRMPAHGEQTSPEVSPSHHPPV